MNLIYAILTFVISTHASILFVDLNNAPTEVNACAKAAGAGQVSVVNRASNQDAPVNAAAVERAIASAEAQGQTLDSIVISGHDGSGEFFGGDDEQNYFTAGQLTEILKKHPRTQASMQEAMLWGCYSGNVGANENYWLKFSDHVKLTVGFPVQSPTKDYKPSFEALGQMCDEKTRLQMQNAVSKDELCAMYRKFPLLAKVGSSLCNHEAVATNLYNDANHHDSCYRLDELHERCAVVDPDQKLLDTYQCYFSGSTNGIDSPPSGGCRTPPLDGSDVNAPPGTSDLRSMYNAAHLYRHCAESLHDDRGYDLPYPPTVIRLVKYRQIADNLNRLNRPQFEDYDNRLDDLALDKYKLGNLAEPDADGHPKDRAWVNGRINGAIASLDRMSRRGVSAGDTKASVVYTMAQGLKATLVDLRAKMVFSQSDSCQADQPPKKCFKECSHFSLVHADIQDPARASRCIMSYENAERAL